MRYTGVISPKIGPVQSLLATEVYFSDGPYKNPENYARYNFFGKFTLDPTPESKLSFWFSAHDGDWDASGQIPLREVHARRLNRFGSLDPSESGKSDRQNINLIYTYTSSVQENWLNQTTGHWYSMKLLEKTPAVRSERSRASGEVEEQATSGSGSLRLRCATLRPNGKDSTASEEVYESSVVRFSTKREISKGSPSK